MEIVRKGAASEGFFSVSLNVLISKEIWAPMHGRAEGFRSSSEFLRVAYVASALHDIDFSTGWPLSVFVMDWEHPDGRPEPISFWQFCLDFHTAILKGDRVYGGEFTTHNRIDVVISVTTSLAAVEGVARALVGWGGAPNVIVVSGSDKVGSNFIFGEDGLDVQDSVFDEGCGSVVVVEFEFPVAAAWKGDVMSPFGEVKIVEGVFEDEFAAGYD